MLIDIALGEIIPSPTNPRKTFDQPKLEELARSIAEKGLIQPLVVRPHHNGGPAMKYELVAGERRFRASKIAGVGTALCIVRELTDVEVLEIQTIENLQRDDLHALEEAQGYADLMKHARYDVAQIAEKIGKSGKYVYDRIKLLQLIPELQKVFIDGEITAGHAILLARLSSAEQQRCLGRGDGLSSGGLFQPEHHDAAPGLELADRRRRKAVSVRELETWINDNVRFDPTKVDLPNLFPETAEALAAAEEEELKVVKITHDYRVPDAARDQKERTYGRPSWKRADGKPDFDLYSGKKTAASKECESAVQGVVVAGPGRGQSFKVCVAKKKCRTHWAAEMKEAEQRAKHRPTQSSNGKSDDRQKKYEEQQRQQREEEARWLKAAPKVREAVVEACRSGAPGKLMDIILGRLEADMSYFLRGKPQPIKRGTSVEDGVRLGAYLVLSELVGERWVDVEEITTALKPLGIDAQKIVDQVAPKEKPKPEPKKERKPAGSSAVEKIKKGLDHKAGAAALVKSRKARGKSADAVKTDG